jgi:hypothetical protein
MMDGLFERIKESVKICEASIRDLKRKQRTISWLYPTFQDRVNKIGDMGGLRLTNTDDDNWDFKVHSGTKKDTWYDCVIHFVNVKDTLKKLVMNRRLWTINKERVDLRKLASEFVETVNVQTFCSCPSDLYSGFHYIRGLPRYDAKYTNPEHRPPKKRNPRQYGAQCKHLSAVMKALPFYNTAIAKWLNQFYSKEIAEYQELAKKELGVAKAGAKELTKRMESEKKPMERPDGRPERPSSGIRRGKTHLEDEKPTETTEDLRDTLRKVWGSFNK